MIPYAARDYARIIMEHAWIIAEYAWIIVDYPWIIVDCLDYCEYLLPNKTCVFPRVFPLLIYALPDPS